MGERNVSLHNLVAWIVAAKLSKARLPPAKIVDQVIAIAGKWLKRLVQYRQGGPAAETLIVQAIEFGDDQPLAFAIWDRRDIFDFFQL